ncbi:hypothetical protein HA402_009880 [Bradysia odoriphaga]|nr:hypothetical protein HA402_009880 [Bradysia odoriphaga]
MVCYVYLAVGNQRNLPCVVLRTGMEGTCMFAIHCLRANGTHLGTCRDGYYFKSCCQIHDASTSVLEHEISDNSIDQNTISHFQHHQSSSSAETLNHKSSTTQRPPINIKNTIVPLHSVTVTHHSSNSRPTLSSTISDDKLVYSTSNDPTIWTSNSDNVVLDLLTTYQNSIITSTDANKIESTSSIMTTTQPSIFTKSPISIGEDNTKFQTFQSVQDTVTTTVSSPIAMKTKSPSRRPTTTTMKPTKRHRPSTSGSESSKPTKEAVSTTKKVVRVPTTTSKPITTTRRPTTTTTTTLANAASSKRPTASIILTKPTRRVTETPVRPLINRNETLPTSRPPATNLQNDPISTLVTQSTAKPVTTTTTSQPFITISYVETTKSPRPKPKPTQQIVKVSPTSLDHLVELEIPLSTVQSFLPSITTSTPSTLQQQPTQSSTMFMETKTEPSTSGIEIPIIAYNESSAENEIKPIVGTTQPTILVTWSNIQVDNNTMENETPAATTIAKPAETTKAPVTISTSTQQTTTNKSTSKKPITTTTTTTSKPTRKPVTSKPSTSKPSTSKPSTSKPSTSKPSTSKPSTSKPTKTSTTTKITTTTEGALTTGSDSSSTQFLAPVESNKTETISSNATSSTEGPMSTTSGTPIVFPSDGITESSLNNETVISGNGTANGTTPSKPLSTNTMPSLEGIDYRQVCGKRMFPEPRIVGGSKASFGRWPWQISLRQWRTSTYLHKCGAALLNENWAITAAHCVDNVPPSDLLLRLGEYDLAEEEEPYGYQERRVQIVASHPQFDPRTFEYDLALLRFYEPVEFQPNIIPVCVPETDENFIGRTAFVTGWGRLYEDGPLPSVLQEVSVPVINNTICESMYRNAGYIEHIPHIFICAGWRKGGYDSCEGDSGGPMVIQRDDKRFLLAGVISWGIGCAEPNQPGVYTRISEFRDWINQILQF